MILTEEKRLQIMSYIVHAGEILQKDKHFPKHLYKYAYLPAGPELYTGTLKAAGYLFLDKTLKNMILIVEQTTHPEDIIGYVNEDKMLIRGNTIENDSQKVVSKIEKIPGELFDQLLYMRIVTNIERVTILGIGNNVKNQNVVKKIKEINYENFGCVFLGKVSEDGSKKEDKNMIRSIFEKKGYKKSPFWLGNKYLALVKKYNGKPEIVVYVHSSELGIVSLKPNGYLCMVG